MTVINEHRLAEFARRHSDARKALGAWLQVVQDADWQSIVDVRGVYPSANGVEVGRDTVATVFNIRGNQYRLVTIVIYAAQTVDIVEVLAHAEYSKGAWKHRV